MQIIKETRLQNIVKDFKFYKKQFADTLIVSEGHWVLLQSVPDSTKSEVDTPAPFYKVPIDGLVDAVLNHEMYQEVNKLTYNQLPYSYVFFRNRLLFLIQFDGRIYNKDGNEIDIRAVQNISKNLAEKIYKV